MRKRAPSSGVALTDADAAVVKGMLLRGDRQHDIAAWFGVNGGRVAEIATGSKFGSVSPSLMVKLPPPGPYPCGKEAVAAVCALAAAKDAVATAEEVLRLYAKSAA
jgi:hypothetical protein